MLFQFIEPDQILSINLAHTLPKACAHAARTRKPLGFPGGLKNLPLFTKSKLKSRSHYSLFGLEELLYYMARSVSLAGRDHDTDFKIYPNAYHFVGVSIKQVARYILGRQSLTDALGRSGIRGLINHYRFLLAHTASSSLFIMFESKGTA